MKDFRKAHEAKVRNAALADALYYGRQEPNYTVLKEKMIRGGATVQGATNTVELLKRQEKARRAAAWMQRKKKNRCDNAAAKKEESSD